MTALTNLANWGVVLATLVVIGATVGLHYEVLLRCTHWLSTANRRRPRRVLILVLIIVLAHTTEIWFFSLGYYALSRFEACGAIVGSAEIMTIIDYAYFSAVVYSTLGFGDLLPMGAIRFMVGMEALTGLVMLAWSGSFTFLEMQRAWPDRPTPG
jgi:Ion channel